jgi:hypothetical protein
MQALALKAHFDGEHIQLDEPAELRPDTEILVMVWQRETPADEQVAQETLAAAALGTAYGDAEPTYTLDLLREPNPDYEGG